MEGQIILFSILIALGIALYAGFARWIFKIDTIVKQSNKQTRLLAEIAAKNGVDVEIIKEIVNNKK
jgi:hypothetical protein